MYSTKRIIIATIFGIITGVLCYLGGKYYADVEFTTGTMLSTILNRTLIGFVIGISLFKLNWALHGIIMGIIVGLPLSTAAIGEGGFWTLLIFSIIWGFIIELFTTVVFKSKHPSAIST